MDAERGRRGVARVEKFIEEWNRQKDMEKEEGEAGAGEENGLVKVIELWRSGYMSLDIQIPDPKVVLLRDAEGRERMESRMGSREGLDTGGG